MTEIWKDIPGYEGKYQCSNLGSVKSFHKNGERILRQQLTHDGYPQSCLVIKTNRKMIGTHRLVAITFIPNPENKKEVNHKNGIKTDNSVGNLEWCTRTENRRHAFKTGLQVSNKGEEHWMAALTEKDVLMIRGEFENGNNVNSIAKTHGLKYKHIWKIVNRETWKHI